MSLLPDATKQRTSLKIGLLVAVCAILTCVTFLIIGSNRNANAVISDWDAGNIISDVIFTDRNSMSINQIQDFLNSKVPVCDTAGLLPASDFGRPDLTHAQYAATRGWPAPPYPCLRDYTEGGLSSAQIIYNVSQQFQISPKVFLVLLQKEQGLVTDTWPLPVQYRSATGYGCPDTAACDTKYYGLTAQLTWAATMFHAIVYNDQNWSNVYGSGSVWYTPYLLGNNYIQWNPQGSCGGTIVNIQNRSTQALYNYTPYQPNASALNSGYGKGDSCGSYGNRNFYLYFTDWFGSTRSPISCLGNETPQSFVTRYYNRRTSMEFYSAYACDATFLNWIGFTAQAAIFNTTPCDSTYATPVYRYYNPGTGLHSWSTDLVSSEALLLSGSGYKQEAGRVFCVARADMPNVHRVDQFYNPRTYIHLFATDPSPQVTQLLKSGAGFDPEGTAFYVQ